MNTTVRTRDRSLPDRSDVLYKYYTDIQGKTSLFASYPCLTARYNEQMTDYVTPGWRKLINSGEMLMFPCSYKKVTLTSGGGSYTAVHSNGSRFYTVGGSITSYHAAAAGIPALAAPIDWNTLSHDATSRCLSNIDRTPYDFAEDLFELRQTLRYIRVILGRITTLCINFTNALRGWNSFTVFSAANLYLEFRFALSPLVRSIYQALLAFQKGGTGKTGRRRARAEAVETAQASDTFVHYWSGTVYDSYHRTASVDAKLTAYVFYEMTNPIHDWRHTLGLRDKDLVIGLWKAAKLSFLIDRLFNVSTLLRGLLNLADPKLHILACCQVRKFTVTTTMTFTEQVNPGYTVTVFGDTVTSVDGGYQRDPWTPTLLDTIPIVTWGNLVKDVWSVLDLFALATQWLGKIR